MVDLYAGRFDCDNLGVRVDQHIDSDLDDHFLPPVRFMPHWSSILGVAWPWFATLAFGYVLVAVLRFMPPFDVIIGESSPLVIAVMFAGSLIAFAKAYIAWRYSVALVHADRVDYCTGLLAMRQSTVELDEIANIDLRQSAFQRIFSAGDVFVDSRAASILAIRGVSDAPGLRDLIRERRRRLIGRKDRRSIDASAPRAPDLS